MAAYDARRPTEQGFDRRKGNSRRLYTSDRETMDGREFLHFLDLMLRCELSAEIREAVLCRTLTVDEAVASLGCIQVYECRGTRYIAEIDKKQRDLLKVFGVPVPNEAVSGIPIFDLPSVG